MRYEINEYGRRLYKRSFDDLYYCKYCGTEALHPGTHHASCPLAASTSRHHRFACSRCGHHITDRRAITHRHLLCVMCAQELARNPNPVYVDLPMCHSCNLRPVIPGFMECENCAGMS